MSQVLGLQLTWENENEFEDGFRIYRSEEPFDKESLPEVYATLPPRTVKYVDTEVDQGTTYYYMVSTFYSGGIIEAETFNRNLMSGVVDSWFESIGTFAYGGYYIGDINVGIGGSGEMSEGTYAILMLPRDIESGTLTWRSPSVTTGASSTIDGLANTRKMRESGNSPAVNWLDSLGILGDGRVSDIYIPAPNELDLAWINRGVNGLSGLLQMRSERYWTSREDSATSAYYQPFSSGPKSSNLKTTAYRVRPVRRIKIA